MNEGADVFRLTMTLLCDVLSVGIRDGLKSVSLATLNIESLLIEQLD